ncbi:MAG TPA: SprT family zinc-dependent metalloprotease [Verrucomicrobiae bacterium]|jgi:hypothetical protein|nr:SprT family zinc-dependent metalloprotease [Verrucomicrobiae bacterium]
MPAILGEVFVNKVRKYFRLLPSPEAGPEPDIVTIHSHPMPVIYRRHARARNYVLRLHANKTVVVTVPRSGSRKLAREFVESRKSWLEKQWRILEAQKPPPADLRPGMEILFRGSRETLALLAADPSPELLLADQRIPFNPEADNVRVAVEKHLRRLAVNDLSRRVEQLAVRHECQVKRVVIRNQRTRWGSCSCHGVISLNWRLIQLPPHVCDYIIIHELMHLRHLNHSPRFWAEVEKSCPEYRHAEDWLKRHATQVGF